MCTVVSEMVVGGGCCVCASVPSQLIIIVTEISLLVSWVLCWYGSFFCLFCLPVFFFFLSRISSLYWFQGCCVAMEASLVFFVSQRFYLSFPSRLNLLSLYGSLQQILRSMSSCPQRSPLTRVIPAVCLHYLHNSCLRVFSFPLTQQLRFQPHSLVTP